MTSITPLTVAGDIETPEWWRHRLSQRLLLDRSTLNFWWRYHVGDHPAPAMPEKIRDKLLPTYKAMLRRSRVNFMRMIVEAYADRMRPIGFWLGGDSDAPRDELSWQLWQASKLDRDVHSAITWALARGRSYLSVWASDDDMPRVAVESPSQVIVEHEPGRSDRRMAALKEYHDDVTGDDVSQVYLPDGVYEFRASTVGGQRSSSFEPSDFFANPLNLPVVPVVPLYNRPETDPTERLMDRPSLIGGGDSEIADLVPIQDRVNETIFNGLIAMWYSSFKQKWATGLTVEKVEKKDSNGEVVTHDDGSPVMVPVEPFDMGADRLLVAEDDTVKFGEFSETNLEGFIKFRERDLEDLTITSRLPRHYLIQQGQAPSGDSMVSAEAGFVGRIRRKFDDFADPIEEAVGIARMFAGADPMPPDAELRWDDPENQSLAQLTDAVLKEFQAGLITWEVALERLNYSPQQIARMRGERQAAGLLERVLEQRAGQQPPEAA